MSGRDRDRRDRGGRDDRYGRSGRDERDLRDMDRGRGGDRDGRGGGVDRRGDFGRGPRHPPPPPMGRHGSGGGGMGPRAGSGGMLAKLGGGGGILGDLAKLAREKAAKAQRGTPTPPTEADEEEAAAKRRKHSPIVWGRGGGAVNDPGVIGSMAAESNPLLDGSGPTFSGSPIVKRSPSVEGSPEPETAGPGPPGSPEEGEIGAGGGGANGAGSAGGEADYERELNTRERAEMMREGPSGGGTPGEGGGAGGEDSGAPPGPEDAPPSPPQPHNMLNACRRVEEFEKLNRIDEGTYGVVFRARDKGTGEVVALKKVKMEKEKEGFPLTSIREINILLSLDHENIVDVKEVVVGSSLDSIFMVMEFMEHDLKGLMGEMKQPFSISEVKCLMQQLFAGMAYLHENWVLHRDLKTSNILFNNRGDLKICDFGLARNYGDPLKAYTHMVVTLWYRAPELLLGQRIYSTAIDMWSLGCIMGELLAKAPLLPGKSELEQIDKIFQLLGTPSDKIWPGYSSLPNVKNLKFAQQPYNNLRKKFPATSFSGQPVLSEQGFDLLNKLLTFDPEKRINAQDALAHPWFDEHPRPKDRALMPTFPTRANTDGLAKARRGARSPDPIHEIEEQARRRDQLAASMDAGGGVFKFAG